VLSATPSNGLTAVSGVAPLEGGWLVAVFYDIEHPTPYNYASFEVMTLGRDLVDIQWYRISVDSYYNNNNVIIT
jgi:hypothetical protein